MSIPEDIIRVFPRRTKGTPDDPLAFVGWAPLPNFRPEPETIREIHVSTTFTWDVPLAGAMVRDWAGAYPKAPVRTGGPAVSDSCGAFEPGMYLRRGYVITSRGCPNRCDFCLVPSREGPLRTLPIREGWDVADNNLLACPREHVEKVCDMLERQPKRARFTGGLEAGRLVRMPWFVDRLIGIRFDVAYIAYDRPAQKGAVERAAKMILEAGGWSVARGRKKVSCYVLCGYEDDTIEAAEARLQWVISIGITPFPMWYRSPDRRKWPAIDAMKRQLRKYMRPHRMFSKAPSAGSAQEGGRQ